MWTPQKLELSVLNNSKPFRESVKKLCLTKVCVSDPVGPKNRAFRLFIDNSAVMNRLPN